MPLTEEEKLEKLKQELETHQNAKPKEDPFDIDRYDRALRQWNKSGELLESKLKVQEELVNKLNGSAASPSQPDATKTASTVKSSAGLPKETDATTQNTTAPPSKPAAPTAQSSDRPKTASSVNLGTQGSPPLKPETPKPKVSEATVSATKPEAKATTTSGGSNTEFKDYYKLLGQPPTASVPALMQACLEKSVSLNIDNSEHQQIFKSIQEAYNTFKDPASKDEYDKKYNENKPGDSSVEISGEPQGASAKKDKKKKEDVEENIFILSTSKGLPDVLQAVGLLGGGLKSIGDWITRGKVTSAENTLNSSMSSLAKEVKQFATDLSIKLAGAVLNQVGKSLNPADMVNQVAESLQDPEGPVAKVVKEGVQQLATLAQKTIPDLSKQIEESSFLGDETKKQFKEGLSAIKQGFDSFLQMQPAAPSPPEVSSAPPTKTNPDLPSSNASQQLKSAVPTGKVGTGNGLTDIGSKFASRFGNVNSAAKQVGQSASDLPTSRPGSAPTPDSALSPRSAPRPAPLTSSRKPPGSAPTPGNTKKPVFSDETASGGGRRLNSADGAGIPTSIKKIENP